MYDKLVVFECVRRVILSVEMAIRYRINILRVVISV